MNLKHSAAVHVDVVNKINPRGCDAPGFFIAYTTYFGRTLLMSFRLALFFVIIYCVITKSLVI